MPEETLKRLFRAFNPNEVLEPGDARIVNCDAARHDGIAPKLAKVIQRAEQDVPMHRLFTGHIGVGKSTELKRLQKILDPSPVARHRFEVIYFDVNDHLDPNDLRLADLLILIAGRVHEHLRNAGIPGFTATNVALQRFWDHVKQFLGSTVELTEVSFETGIASLTTELKQGDPTRREQVREAINRQRTSLRAGVNELLVHAAKKLRASKKTRGLVIIADGLEKIPSHLHEDLFINGCEALVDVSAHVIYTVPMPLAYLPRFNTIMQAFGHHTTPVPMLHVDSDDGMQCLHEIIARRCEHAGTTTGHLFDTDETRDYLCAQTGGHLRHLMMFIQSALNQADDLPITRQAVDGALRDYRHGMARSIPGTFWPWLRMFRPGPLTAFPDAIPEEIRRDMLQQLLVFEYTNGEPSYDVNPVIRGMQNFTHGEPAKPLLTDA